MPNWTKEQSEAINKENSNIIVSAGAGSGKTAVLSERVIRKLKSGVHINELLLLTFTKLAASEMKERIRKKIKKENLLDELDMIDGSYITTFDSFALSMVKKYHYLLNVSPSITIIDDSVIKVKKEEILDDILEEKYKNNDSKFINLINDFCVKDDHEIRKELLTIISKLDMLPNKKEYLNDYINNFYNEDKINKDINKYVSLIIDKIDSLNDLCNNLSDYTDSDYMTKVYDSLNNLLNSKTYDDIKNNLDISLPRLSNSEGKEAKDKITDTIKEIKSLCCYEDIDYIKKSINKTKIYVEALIDIILEFDTKITNYKYEYDAYEFTDIALLAIDLVKNNLEVREEIKNSFKEIMIDEYQDTNDLQEEFIKYIANNNVYMVGDIKQSIYRFRNANPNIFKNKYDTYSKLDGGIKIDLNKNFRSRKEVLDNINLMFNLIMTNLIGGADYLISHQMVFGNNTYINEGNTNQDYNLDLLEYDFDKESIYSKDEIECFIIAKDIKEKVESKYQIFDKDELILRNIKYSDFVILLDRSTNFDLFKKIFEYNHIPLNIFKDEKMDDDVIYVINNLFKFIVKVYNNEFDTDFKYLFISIMRSFLYNIKDNVIFKYFLNKNFYDSDLFIKSKEISKLIDNHSINDLIDIILDKFDYYNKLTLIGNIESNIIKIDKIKETSSNLSNLNYNFIMFTEHLDKMLKESLNMQYKLDTDSGDSVKIMTIHASKGLEYHICYFANLYKKFNLGELKEKFLYSNKYGIVTPYFDEGIDNTIYKQLLKEEYLTEEISEKIRLFYVALTRAKEKMIMVLPSTDKEVLDNSVTLKENVKMKYRSFLDMIYSIKNKLDNFVKKIDLNNINLSKDYNLIKISNYKDNIDIIDTKLNVNEININNEEITSDSFSKKMHELINLDTQKNIELGLKMHEILENTDFNNVNITDPFVRSKIDVLLNSKIFSNIKNAKIYKEYEFMYIKDDTKYHGIIDLMLEYDDHIDIVDYKLKNVDDENYINQLNGYKDFIKSKSKKIVNLYLYSILDGIIKEIK